MLNRLRWRFLFWRASLPLRLWLFPRAARFDAHALPLCIGSSGAHTAIAIASCSTDSNHFPPASAGAGNARSVERPPTLRATFT